MPEQLTTEAAAGWYADPEDPAKWRYWNGTIWTDQRKRGRTPAVAPVSAGRRVGGIVLWVLAAFFLLSALSGVVAPPNDISYSVALGIAIAFVALAYWLLQAGHRLRGTSLRFRKTGPADTVAPESPAEESPSDVVSAAEDERR